MSRRINTILDILTLYKRQIYASTGVSLTPSIRIFADRSGRIYLDDATTIHFTTIEQAHVKIVRHINSNTITES
jgi:hypothetical protein